MDKVAKSNRQLCLTAGCTNAATHGDEHVGYFCDHHVFELALWRACASPTPEQRRRLIALFAPEVSPLHATRGKGAKTRQERDPEFPRRVVETWFRLRDNLNRTPTPSEMIGDGTVDGLFVELPAIASVETYYDWLRSFGFEPEHVPWGILRTMTWMLRPLGLIRRAPDSPENDFSP